MTGICVKSLWVVITLLFHPQPSDCLIRSCLKIQHPVFQVAAPPSLVPISPYSPAVSPALSNSDMPTSDSADSSSDSDYRPSSRMESPDPLTPNRPHLIARPSTPPPPVIDLTSLLSSPSVATPHPRSKVSADAEVIDLTLITPRKPTKLIKRPRASSSPAVPQSVQSPPYSKKVSFKKARFFDSGEEESDGSDNSVILLEKSGSQGRVLGLSIREGDVFGSLAEAKFAIKAAEEARGFILVMGQTKRHRNGVDIARMTMRCQSYR